MLEGLVGEQAVECRLRAVGGANWRPLERHQPQQRHHRVQQALQGRREIAAEPAINPAWMQGEGMDAVRIVPPRKLLRVQHVRKLALTIKLPECSLPRPSMDVFENNPRTFRLGTTAGIVVVHEGADVYDPRAPIGLEQGEKKVGQAEMTNVVGHETGIIRLPSESPTCRMPFGSLGKKSSCRAAQGRFNKHKGGNVSTIGKGAHARSAEGRASASTFG